MTHDAFISYSHAADGSLAPALQRGLEQLAKPWWQRRALRVFRDETNLSASPQLWQSIVDELAQSRWFLLLASAEAAGSKWVTREVQWWLQHRDSAHLLILLTSGELAWDEAAETPDFDWPRTTALPRALARVFLAEPHFIDVRGLKVDLKGSDTLTLKHTGFRAAVLKIAAPLHGKSPDEMDGDAVRVQARNRRWAGAAVAGLVALTAMALWQRHVAIEARDTALSRQLAAQSTALLERSVDTALLLAVQAWQTRPTPEARSAMLRGLQLGPVARFLPGPGGAIVGVAIDTEARRVIAADRTGVVRVASDGSAPDWSYRSDKPVTRLAVTADAELVALGRNDGSVLLLVPGQAAPLHVLKGRHEAAITALAFSADGSRLVSGSRSEGIALWDVREGSALGGVPEVFNRFAVDALAISDDGQRIFAAMGFGITVWDSRDFTRLGMAAGEDGAHMLIDALATVAGADALIATGSDDKERRIWRWPMSTDGLTKRSVLHTLANQTAALALDAKGWVVGSGSHGGEVVFVETGFERRYKLHKGEVNAVALSADGRRAVSGGADGRIVLWNRAARAPYSGALGVETRGRAGIAASPDGRWLVSGNDKGQLLWMNTQQGRPAVRVGEAVPTVGQERSQLRGVTALAFAPDGSRLAVGLGDGSTVIQLPDGGSAQRAVDWGAGYPVLALAFAPDGATLASAHYDGSVILRDGRTAVARSAPALIFNDAHDGIRALGFSSDGQQLWVQTNRRGVVVRSVAAVAKASRATTEQTLALAERDIRDVRFTTLARAPSSRADSLAVWANNRGRVELRKSGDTDSEPHSDVPALQVEGGLYIQSMALSPDGRTLAMTGDEPGILLWDLQERRPVDEPLRSARGASSLAFSGDGRFLVSRYSNGELEWWSTDGNHWAALLCAMVNRHLGEREWAAYVGGPRAAGAACEGAGRGQEGWGR